MMASLHLNGQDRMLSHRLLNDELRNLTRRVFVLTLAFGGGGFFTFDALEAGQFLGQEPPIRVDVELVLLNVSVRDRTTNRSVSGLQAEDFRVYEDGVVQQAHALMARDVPYSLLLLMDVSGSTWSYIKLMKQAATEFTRQIDQEDELAVASFNSRIKLLQSFTNDRDALERGIARLQPGGGTAFYDALINSTDRYLNNIKGRKAIVVFTDGFDNVLDGDPAEGSRASYQQLCQRLEEEEALVYPILLDTKNIAPKAPRQIVRRPPIGGADPPTGRFPFPVPPITLPARFPRPFEDPRTERTGSAQAAFKIAHDQLQALADQTGGRMFTPRRAEDLSDAYAEIADELRVQYLLSYSPSNKSRGGGWRRIDVSVKDHPEVVVRTRKGYRAVERPR